MRRKETYRELILDNICYDALSQSSGIDKNRLDELVELIVDTVCSKREMIRIAGDDHPVDVVRSRFLKLNAEHIEYILDRMEENTTRRELPKAPEQIRMFWAAFCVPGEIFREPSAAERGENTEIVPINPKKKSGGT